MNKIELTEEQLLEKVLEIHKQKIPEGGLPEEMDKLMRECYENNIKTIFNHETSTPTEAAARLIFLTMELNLKDVIVEWINEGANND